MHHRRLLVMLIASLTGCVDKTDADYRAEIATAMHDSIGVDLANLLQAARDLQAASPSVAWHTVPDEDGAILRMRDAWKRMRTAYEDIEGAIVALFPGTDATMDARYDETLAKTGPDQDLFDDRGFTGMHGIERILYAPEIRNEVTLVERRLKGYKPAAYPASDDEAIEFKTQLVELLIDNAKTLRKQWRPDAVDIGTAYVGLVGLMREQNDKLNLAATGEEESRYANITMFDLRQNLGGTQKVYDLFGDWIRSKAAGPQSDSAVRHKFGELETIYYSPSSPASSDALPSAPSDWSPDHPTPANLATPFGTLWQGVHDSVDPSSNGSVVYEMNRIADLLDFPAFVPRRASITTASPLP